MTMSEQDICRLRIGGNDVPGAQCGVCGHTNLAHPGFPNPSLEECPTCRLLYLIDQAKATRRETAFLVLIDPGGLFGCFFDRDRAARQAEAVEGVLLEVPVIADYRKWPTT